MPAEQCVRGADLKELLLVLALLLSIAWLILRIRRGKAEVREASAVKNVKSTSAFHAVSLRYSSNACDAAKAMTGRRFLATAAPRLPLPGCDALECRCGFDHHEDRRSGRDRRNPFSSIHYEGGTGSLRVERRSKKDRRTRADCA
ncbi:MAG: hypothetical protein OEM50_10670 [Gammaproteobacteria bacterium]|nr:hypothetical protein [Gammaproteobacteria bacterium]MDH3482169.1 hypothetical protein [Gammaproteobacteria bacterium]